MAEIAAVARRSWAQLHGELVHEFGEAQCKAWDAKILYDNTVHFNAPRSFVQKG